MPLGLLTSIAAYRQAYMCMYTCTMHKYYIIVHVHVHAVVKSLITGTWVQHGDPLSWPHSPHSAKIPANRPASIILIPSARGQGQKLSETKHGKHKLKNRTNIQHLFVVFLKTWTSIVMIFSQMSYFLKTLALNWIPNTNSVLSLYHCIRFFLTHRKKWFIRFI